MVECSLDTSVSEITWPLHGVSGFCAALSVSVFRPIVR
jgi:hypothetical protein